MRPTWLFLAASVSVTALGSALAASLPPVSLPSAHPTPAPSPKPAPSPRPATGGNGHVKVFDGNSGTLAPTPTPRPSLAPAPRP